MICCVGFGKCSGGKCTLMSLSDLTGERARLASFSIIFLTNNGSKNALCTCMVLDLLLMIVSTYKLR